MNSWAYLYVTLWLRCVSLWSNSIYSFIYNKCADKSFPTFLCWGTNFLNFECLLWLGYVLRPVMKKGSVRFESTWSHDIVTLEKLLKSNFLCGDHLTHLIPGDIKAFGQITHQHHHHHHYEYWLILSTLMLNYFLIVQLRVVKILISVKVHVDFVLQFLCLACVDARRITCNV